MSNSKMVFLALLGTGKLLVIAILCWGAGRYIATNFTNDEIAVGISLTSSLFLLYLIFDLKLSQIKHENAIDKLTGSK
jgi:hypothetical protein